MELNKGLQYGSESERYLFDPHKKFIHSNNEKHLGSGDPYYDQPGR